MNPLLLTMKTIVYALIGLIGVSLIVYAYQKEPTLVIAGAAFAVIVSLFASVKKG